VARLRTAESLGIVNAGPKRPKRQLEYDCGTSNQLMTNLIWCKRSLQGRAAASEPNVSGILDVLALCVEVTNSAMLVLHRRQ
jgi:hypothetical protein